MAKTWLAAAALLGMLAVVFGAFGAHWLEGAVKKWSYSSEEQTKALATWETAVRYQMYHALALFGLGLLALREPSSWWNWTGGAMTLGVLIFSGLLYALVLSGVKILGAIVPIGGTLMIVGWLVMLLGALRAVDS